MAARIQPPSHDDLKINRVNGFDNKAYGSSDDGDDSEMSKKSSTVDTISKSDSYRHVFREEVMTHNGEVMEWLVRCWGGWWVDGVVGGLMGWLVG